jgi:hypothetical protein
MKRLDKNNYYLDIAEAALERSTCLRRKWGAVIVKDDEIISTGYNGAPRGRKNCTDIGTCIREECVPGEYVGRIIIYNGNDEWGERVSSIIISKDDKANEIGVNSMKKIGSIGVDVGLAGFFNNKPDFPGNKWYDFLCESGVRGKDGRHDYSKRCYDCEYGLFSESGYGDGRYDVYAFPEKDGFMISFI